MSHNTANTTPLRRVGRTLKSCFLLLWFGKAAYLGFWTTSYPSYGLLAASFLAIKDGLVTMPETLVDLGATFSFLAGLNNQLTRELGYAPFGVPDGNLNSDPMFWFILICVAVLSVVQFMIWLMLKKRGVTILWPAPCIPDIFEGKMKLMYWIICWLVIAVLCLISLNYGIITAIVTGLFLALTMRFPLLAGTTFWLLEITQFGSSGSFWSRFKTGWSKTRSHSGRNYYEDNEGGYDDGSGDLRPIFPPVLWRIRSFIYGLMRPVFAMPFSWRIRWA